MVKKPPKVAIVGRPNVGKSTLFRLLTRKRVIISPIPHTTRDRISALWQIDDGFVELMDMGGWTEKGDALVKHIIEQIEQALSDLDLIIFMVDKTAGLNPDDIALAELLRRTDKPVILVINKVDRESEEANAYEFASLGFDRLIPISAKGRRNISELTYAVKEVIGCLPTRSEIEEDIRVAIVGKPNVGKSSILNAILGEERVLVDSAPGTTRDTIDTYLKYHGESITLIDTAGLRRKARVKKADQIEWLSVRRAIDAIERSDVCLLILDALEPITHQDKTIASYTRDMGKGCILCVNKIDLIQEMTSRLKDEIELNVRKHMRFIPYAPVILTSAVRRKNINRLLKTILSIHQNWKRRINTSELNNIEIEPITIKGKERRVYYMAQVDTRPPKFMIASNFSDKPHFSYKRYVENRIRNNFDFTGTPIILKFKKR
ncbi:MAG: ribosome biogenesis GTPase Der [Candidatus Coatesbacteria bacterium]|nr:MAG: ribosome biogenesis GTPase Der [Candidatus Coatesbacteria bacterium]RLC41571.1 MAG: ribosome biogenesis GTPase Der [Candidatus Coatesbacteria bacterium]